MIPDPAHPDVVTFLGVLGAFLGVTWARWKGDDDLGPWIAEWTYYGVAIGLLLYLWELEP